MQLAVIQLCLLLCVSQALAQLGPTVTCNLDGFCFCTGHQVGDLVPDCKDCSAYYKCGASSIQHELCPPGFVFDVQLRACAPGKCPRVDGECSTSTFSPPPPDDCQNSEVQCAFHGQIIPHDEHCRFFWTCVENCPRLGFCEIGKWFDRKHFVCDFPSNVRNCPAGRD
ncbi:uncharacterized protein [Drosophila virilis]|uniref:uncharacterized protein isoform X1 n=1 Tax=Drosophila virilis TaxID=7244 RepID=UPI0038B34C1F